MYIRKGGLETKRPTQAQSDLDALQGPLVACFNQLYGFTSVVFVLFFSVVPWKMKGYSAAHEIVVFGPILHLHCLCALLRIPDALVTLRLGISMDGIFTACRLATTY